MENLVFDDIEIAPVEVVKRAARDFAAALAETPQFKAFEQAYEVLSHDTAAQQALSAYRDKAESLRALLMLNAVSETERAELERLKQDYLTRASMQAYAAAEVELTAICQQAAGMISAAIGLNYAASCGASCCG
jgi:cell fate (sporulation/competence/biofilm development) regulator YlbF (YheA/YmcA/DUF963 family)